MGIFDAMGSAAGGMMGGGARAAMGGGNGGSFAQKQPMGQGQPMGGLAGKFAMAQQKRPQFAQQQPGMRMGQQMMRPQVEPRMGGGIGPRMEQGMPPPFMQRQPMPTFPQDGGMMRPQVQGPNGESPNQMGQQQEMQRNKFAQMLQQMQRPQQQQPQRGYNTGIAGGMGRGIAPQLSMMPQMMQQPRQPNPYGAEEEMY